LAPAGRLTDDAAATVYFCCSEALQNVAKYAGASHVSIEVMAVGGELMFAVADDGRGFDPNRGPAAGGGLHGLDDRASLYGGWIAVDAAPGGGTRVRGAVPLLPVAAAS
jgi:signal transduction histidine kinase